MILDGYDFIKYPALVSALGLTTNFVWKKLANSRNDTKELIAVLVNIYKLFIPYCGLNSNNDLSYKDKGLFVFLLDKLTNILSKSSGDKKIVLIKLLEDLKLDRLSLQQKAAIIKLEQERLLFGV